MIKEIEKYFAQNGIEEAAAEAKLLVTCVSGLSIEEILLNREIKNSDEIHTLARKRVQTKAPIQHIIGFSYFMGDKFFVNENVLIPRPETELLVRAAVKEVLNLPAKSCINVLDIGTGTGCIAIEIAKNLPGVSLEVMGVDISLPALETAIDNMNLNNLERRVVFRKSDVFLGLRPCDKFDVIVSNPPYIPICAKDTLQEEVKNFEPALALFADDECGTTFYEKIISGAKNHLKQDTDGCIIFELGEGQSEKVVEIAEKYGFRADYCLKDLAGINRVLCIRPQ